MALEEIVTKLRKQALAQRRQPTPDAYQGVSKARIADVLREIDRYTPDCAVKKPGSERNFF